MDNSLELYAEFTVDTASEFGIKFCTGETEETVIGYNAGDQEIFLDRTRSGDSTFSNDFAGVHRASLIPEQGKISMNIFTDSGSVEVFANNGRAVISDLIFPKTQNISLEFYTSDGRVHINRIEIWKLVIENK